MLKNQVPGSNGNPILVPTATVSGVTTMLIQQDISGLSKIEVTSSFPSEFTAMITVYYSSAYYNLFWSLFDMNYFNDNSLRTLRLVMDGENITINDSIKVNLWASYYAYLKDDGTTTTYEVKIIYNDPTCPAVSFSGNSSRRVNTAERTLTLFYGSDIRITEAYLFRGKVPTSEYSFSLVEITWSDTSLFRNIPRANSSDIATHSSNQFT